MKRSKEEEGMDGAKNVGQSFLLQCSFLCQLSRQYKDCGTILPCSIKTETGRKTRRTEKPRDGVQGGRDYTMLNHLLHCSPLCLGVKVCSLRKHT